MALTQPSLFPGPCRLEPLSTSTHIREAKVRKAEDGVWGNLGRLAMTAPKPDYETLVSALPWGVCLGNQKPLACD